MAEEHIYVLHWFSGKAAADANGNVVRFAGPFSDHSRASEWGAKWQEENGDNPCWQVVHMPWRSTTTFIVPIVAKI
jgi:hypothetical protein